MKKFIKKFGIPFLGALLLSIGALGYYFRDNLNERMAPVQEVVVTPSSSTSKRTTNDQPQLVAGSGAPVRIEIPDADINIPVIDGYYNAQSQTWTLSKTNAQYAVMTPKPNTKQGNTFIYGHALSKVFGRLPQVRQGSLVYITTDKQQRFIYRMKYSFTTDPAHSDFLNYHGAPILSLQTCSGARYQNRSIYVFDLIGVKNA